MNKTFHFAILTENFPPFIGGGIAEWTHGIAHSLSKMGHQVTVFAKWKRKVNIDIHDNKIYNFKPMFGKDWGVYRGLYAFYYTFKFLLKNPDGVVIATTWDLASRFDSLRKLFKSSKLIVVAHGKEITKVKKGKLQKKFQRTVKQATMVVAVSQFTQKEIYKRLVNGTSEHIVFIPNGIELGEYYYTKNYIDVLQKLGINLNVKIILTLARVIERKGHDTVIHSLPKILKEFPETVYIIAGPKQAKKYYQNLCDLISELSLQNHVIFTDEVSKQNLNKFYSLCDVYVMVSKEIPNKGDSEGFGITFLEANACECPVIGSYSGGIPDAIEENKSGFIIPEDAEDDLADKILTLFRDPELAKKMGQFGRQRVEQHFTWQKISERLLNEFLDRLIG
jgi:phosphatidylinositol alpha-1,6-mannosyltransferase